MDLTQLFTGLNFDGQYLDIAGPGLSGRNPLTTDFALDFALNFVLDGLAVVPSLVVVVASAAVIAITTVADLSLI